MTTTETITGRSLLNAIEKIIPEGWTASWDHTGGGCGAIGLYIIGREWDEDAPYLMVTDHEGPFSYHEDWDEALDRPFAVGTYWDHEDSCEFDPNAEPWKIVVTEGYEATGAAVLAGIARLSGGRS